MPKHRRPPPPFTRIIDTGTSHHNLALGDGDPQHYVEYKTIPPAVMIPNGENITTRAHYNLRLQNVSPQASEADILPSFKHSLLSVGQLCDDDCTAIFSKHHCTIYNKRQEPVITGIRNHSTGLYEQCLPETNKQTLRLYYEAVSVDWTGTLYCGITLKWDYLNRTCELSMPGYVKQALQKFNYEITGIPKNTDAPHPYKATKKLGLPMTHPTDNSAKLSPHEIKHLQQIVGTFLFYSRAVDPTMLTALSTIATKQSQSTPNTKEKADHFLKYAASHPDATIKFFKSDMILKIHSDASYLSEQQGRSRAGGHFYLGNREDQADPLNGPILNTTGILANVMSAASEAEAAALFTNMKEGVIQYIALEEMQWPQPPTPITVDNSTAAGLARDTIKANKSRAMDMRLHWIQDWAQQQQFLVTWAPGKLNKADYFTKLHGPILHCRMRFVYLHPPSLLTNPAHLSHANLSCGGVLKPGVHPRDGNPEVTGIPQVDSSTCQ